MTGPRAETILYDGTWLDVQRRQIATQALAAMLTSKIIVEQTDATSKTLAISAHEFMAHQAFSLADAMLDQAVKTPANRKAQVALWLEDLGRAQE